MSINFSPDSPLGKQLAYWWLRLKDDGASRAELKRCDSIEKVMLTASFQRLCHQLQPAFGEGDYWQERLAAVVGLASHLKHEHEAVVLSHPKNQVEKLAVQLAEDVGGGRPKVSELRFRRLLQRDANDLYAPMIRTLRMLKGSANLFGLAESVFYWGDEVKKRWAFAYFPKVSPKK